jgi:hypothetical protein
MPKTTQLSKEKRQSIFALRHEGQSIGNISRTCSRKKTSSAMMKLALVRTATGKEDPLPQHQRISSLELPASEIAAHINVSQSSSNRHI